MSDLLGEYLTELQCANELRVCIRTLRRWHALGVAPPVTKLGRRLMYRRASVADWLARREAVAA